MKTTLQIEITSDRQKKKIHKAEKLLDEAGIKFDKGTDLERNVREWQFEKMLKGQNYSWSKIPSCPCS